MSVSRLSFSQQLNVREAASTKRAVILGVTAFACTIFLAQQPPNATPTLRKSVDLVQINVVVHGKNAPASDLTKSDFAIFDQGKQQSVSVFSIDSAHKATYPPSSLPAGMFSNVPGFGSIPPNSITVILLDNLNTLSGGGAGAYETTPTWLEDHALASAKEHLIEFVKTLSPTHRVAIYGLSDTLHVVCDFTSDRDQLLAVLGKYDPVSKTLREKAQPGEFHIPNTPPEFGAAVTASAHADAAMVNQNRSQTTMMALLAIAAHLADIPGRKNLVWLTADVPLSNEAIVTALSRANIATYPVDARRLLPFAPALSEADNEAAARVFAHAARDSANVPGLPTDSEPPGDEAMREIAEETGGRAFTNTNDITGAIRQAVEDSAVSYTLGFYVSTDTLDGKFHEIKVKVKRPGLNVRYPRGYFAVKDAAVSNAQNQNNLMAAVRSPLEFSAIPLFARVERMGQSKTDWLRVVGGIDIRNVQLIRESSLREGSIEVDIVQQDTTGNVLNETPNKLALRLTDKQFSDYLKSGILFEQLVELRPGVTTLRVVVEDPSTAYTGSVIVPLSQVK